MANQFQTGIVAEASVDACFLTLSIKAGNEPAVKPILASLPQVITEFTARYSDVNPHAVVAIGSEVWDRLYDTKPALLQAFPTLETPGVMPNTPVDLLLHIRSDRRDITHLLEEALYKPLSEYVDVVEEIFCFRFLESRDMTGFVDGTENPQGEDRLSVALVGDEDAEFVGGSYLHLQRYVHNMKKWSTQSLKEKEDTYGRTQDDNIEYASADKPLTAHTKRASIKNAQGQSLELLRQSLPYGGVKESGLMFASYCRTPDNFNLILKSMVDGDGHGHTDRMLQFTRAVTGQAFFAPSPQWLKTNG